MVAGDLVNTASRVQSAAEPGTVFVGEATRRATRADDRLRGRRRARAKGKAEPVALWRALRVVSGRARLAQVGGARGAVRRPRPRAAADQGPLPRAAPTSGKAHLVSVTGIAGIGKSRLAWEFYKYFDGLAEPIVLAPRPLPRLRRGRHLLGARRHGADALPDRRGRGAGRRRCAKLRATLEEHLARRGGAALRRAAARAPARARRSTSRRPAGPVRRLAPLLRAPRGGLSDGARVRGHAVGRREPARLRRVPARVVAQPPALRVTLARPELHERRPTWGAGQRNFTSLYLEPLSPEAMERAARRDSCRASRASCAEQILDARRGRARCTRSRRCGCCSTAALLVQEGAGLPADGRDRDARGAGDAARADRRPPRRPLRPRSGGCSRTAAVLGKTFTQAGARRARRLDGDELEPLLDGARAQGGARRCRPTRARPSTASTASSRTSSATSPTRRSRSGSGKPATSPPPSTSTSASERGRGRRGARVALPRRLRGRPRRGGRRRDPGEGARDARPRGRARGLARRPAEAQRYFARAAELTDDRAARAGLLDRAGQAALRANVPPEARELLESALRSCRRVIRRPRRSSLPVWRSSTG